MRIHVDTDLGSDTDDLCALAMLLGWPGVEITGITTVSDVDGMRVGFIDYVLGLMGRRDIPVAEGAAGSLAGYYMHVGFPDLRAHWPEPIVPRRTPVGAALDLLAESIAAGATIVAIGPYTNLALLETARPGSLDAANVVLMGGCVTPLRADLPPWGPDMDYNVQQDTGAARIVLAACNPILVQVPVTLQVHLRRRDLPALRAAGPLGALLARQAKLYGAEPQMAGLGRQYGGLPDDLLNFQHDALACAVAAGWDGVRIEDVPLTSEIADGLLHFSVAPDGTPTRVITAVDAERFATDWLAAVTSATRSP